MTRAFQWAFIVVVLFIFACVVIVRQAQKEDREEEKLKRLSQEQFAEANRKQNATAQEDNDGASSNIAYKTAPTEDYIAYKTPS